MQHDERPDPEALLKAIQLEESKHSSGKLKIFLGMSAGVGKTYAMLKGAHQQIAEGRDVVIGYVDTHGRQETEELLQGISIIPTKWIEYRETVFEELDLEGVIQRHPQLVLVDELAHTNVPGSRHPKRWQDIFELLEAGIDVYTTVNVQHIESRKDLVESIAEIAMRETVPDLVIDRASEVELVDITPPNLLKRLQEGKVYLGSQSRVAAENFFKEERLTALREIALRLTAEKVDHDLDHMRTAQLWKPNERLMVAIDHHSESQFIIRAARRLAASLNAPWIAVHVDMDIHLDSQDKLMLTRNLDLARQLGAEALTTQDTSLSAALKRLAAQKKVTQIIIGRSAPRRWKWLFSNVKALNKLVNECTEIDVHVIRLPYLSRYRRHHLWHLPTFKDLSPYWYTAALFVGLAIIGKLLLPFFDRRDIGFIFLLGILLISPFSERGPILLGALLSSILWYLLFLPPLTQLKVADIQDFVFFLLYFLTALITGTFISRVKQSEKMVRRREANTQALYEITQEIASGRNTEAIMESVTDKLGKALNGKCSLIFQAPEGSITWDINETFMGDEKERSVALWSLEKGKAAGWSTDTLPSVQNLYLPLKGLQEVIGVLVYQPEKEEELLSMEEMHLLHTVVRQLAAYLDRSFTEQRARKQEYVQQSGRIQRAIVDSIISELLLYLDITRQATVNLEKKSPTVADEETVGKIQEATEVMQRVLNNILAMSNLNVGFLALQKNEHSIAELVRLSLDSLDDQLFASKVIMHIPPDLPLVNFDLPLMQLLLTHLLEMMLRFYYKGLEIAIKAMLEQKHVRIGLSATIAGGGAGSVGKKEVIPDWQMFTSEETNLGYSVAKTIAEIHGGKLDIALSELVLQFDIYLPLWPSKTLAGE